MKLNWKAKEGRNMSKKYTVEITETLQKRVEVEAESLTEAHKKAKEKYYDEEIILGAEDHTATEIRVLGETEWVN